MQFLSNVKPNSDFYHRTSAILVFCFCNLLFLFGGEALPVNFTVPPAVFAFGDSIIDQGNNNNLVTPARCNFAPYGKDFPTGKPTGRCVNGRSTGDLLAEAVGVKEFMPAYLDPNMTDNDFITGVSFASAGAGFDDLTPLTSLVFSMPAQLNMLQVYTQKLKSIVGEERANFTITNAVYFVICGTDDLANTYHTLRLRQIQYDIPSYSNVVAAGASKFVQGLHELGARKIVVLSIPPIGCLPLQRTLAAFPFRHCAENYNEDTTYLNSILGSEMETLSNTFPQGKVLFLDVYTPFLNMIQHPEHYGFEVADRGCCGTGLIETVITCNPLVPTCPDATKYIFWDSYHPTTQGYSVLLDQILPQILEYISS